LLQGTAGVPKNLTSNDVVGTDLSVSHPISFVYDKNLANLAGDLKDPTISTTSLGGTIQHDLLDINNKVQCPSCHEVHDPTYYRFLKMSNAASALCLTCHNK
jgi:predicted CXXCH cytochrome family protein